MKRAAIIIAVILVIAAYYVRPWEFWGVTKPVLLPPQGDLTLIDTGFPHYTPRPPRYVLSATSAEAASVMSWIRDHQTGWRVSLVDYAPHTKLMCDTFMLDIQSDALVLNYVRWKRGKGWVQIVRRLSSEEQLFWQSFIARVKRPNQAMQPTAGRCTVSLSMTNTRSFQVTLALTSGG